MTTKKSPRDVTGDDGRVTTVVLKNRIRELEQEVLHLKRRLDELRKAKNTTVLKREREVIEVTPPNLGRRGSHDVNKGSHDDKVIDLERQLKGKDEKHKRELEDIRHKLKELSTSQVPQEVNCGHESLIQSLQQRISLLEGDNAALLVENKDLKERVDSLYTDLSIKEANTVEIEQKTEERLKIKWQEMYAEWMKKTEAKLNELNQANMLLQGMLRRQNPDGATKDRHLQHHQPPPPT